MLLKSARRCSFGIKGSYIILKKKNKKCNFLAINMQKNKLPNNKFAFYLQNIISSCWRLFPRLLPIPRRLFQSIARDARASSVLHSRRRRYDVNAYTRGVTPNVSILFCDRAFKVELVSEGDNGDLVAQSRAQSLDFHWTPRTCVCPCTPLHTRTCTRERTRLRSSCIAGRTKSRR